MKQRILIADDDPVIISLVSLRLELADYEVMGAANGHEALTLIRAREPAMVILDVQMPGKDGLAVLNEIKSDPFTARLPVMMLTGDRNTETVMSAVGAGAADFMVKPFDPERLLARVSRLVKSSAQVWAPVENKLAARWEV